MRYEFSCHENWHSRRLPHYDAEDKYQMITYRLADSLPKNVIEIIKNKCEQLELESKTGVTGSSLVKENQHPKQLSGVAGGSPVKKDQQTQYRLLVEKYLDQGHGSCLLSKPQYAKIIIDNWHHFDQHRYDLISYTVMPNHVHLLIKTYPDWPLEKVVHAWKSYTAHQILNLENNRRAAGEPRQEQALWQREYWDRFIRDEKHFNSAIEYIVNNPVKTGLVIGIEDWPYSYVSNSSFSE